MNKFLILVVLSLSMLTVVRAQESHVEAKYFKEIDRTVVNSDLIYAINNPSQFLQIQLRGRFVGKGKPAQMPDRLSLEIYSFARDPLYQSDANRRLKVKVDDQVLDFGLLSYSKLDGKGKDEKSKTNPKPLGSNLAFDVSIPEAAQITRSVNKSLLTVEVMSIQDFRLSELRALAAGTDVIMKVGSSVFRLAPVHLEILRQFADAVTAPNLTIIANAAEPAAVAPDVPSDGNNASLADTLKWLKTRLTRDSATKDVVIPRKFEPIDFDTCRISYRVLPLVQHPPNSNSLVYLIREYQLNLADLNPEAVVVSDVTDFATVTMVTRDYQAKIRVFEHANENGMMGVTRGDSLTELAAINLKNKAAALQYKTALVHAINLCQNGR